MTPSFGCLCLVVCAQEDDDCCDLEDMQDMEALEDGDAGGCCLLFVSGYVCE